MNKIKNLESLEALRSKLPKGPRTKPQKRSSKHVAERPQQRSQQPLSEVESNAYAEAFDALLTLWQTLGTLPSGMLPTHVRQAQTAATLRLAPLLNAAIAQAG